MACPPPAMEQEKTFLAALAKSAMFTIDQGVLTLSDADNQPLLSFSIYAATPLVDTEWRVLNYNNGRRGFVANQSSQKMSARFDSEGQVAGSAGCNNYSAAYQRTEATITIGPARTTRKMCAEPKDVMRDEQEYLAALSRAVSFELDGDKLTLFDADNKRVVIFRAGHIE